MSKVFQIVDQICYWDATKQFPTIEDTFGKFPPDVKFVTAPDYVFEGWGYDESSSDPWIKPTPPEGWLYDEETGTFYMENPPEELKPVDQRIAELKATVEEQQAIIDAMLGVAAEEEGSDTE